MSQLQHLFDAEGRLRLDVQGRARLGVAGESCCCDSTCANYVKVKWCCDPLREAWAWMNRPECPGHVPGYPSLPTDRPQTFKVNSDPASACWTSDPVPEGNVRAYGDVPQGAVFIPFGEGTVLVDNCLVPECLNCPECCGSRTMPDGCGGWISPGAGKGTCCECGDNYTLTITETMQATGTATAYADPCTTFPSIGTGPSWDVEITRTATFLFGCEEVDDGNGGTFLRRKVTGQSVLNRVRRGHYARIEYQVPRDNFDPTPCALISFQPGHRTVTDEAEIVRSWNELGIGGEGCGLTRDQVSVEGPEDYGLSRPALNMGAFQAMARFDAGECSGSISQRLSPCDPSLGGADAWSCRMGTALIGFDVEWSGSRNCSGGAYNEKGMFQAAAVPLRADVAVRQLGNANSGVVFESTWGGDEGGSWTYSVQWSVSGGDACQVDPCGDQNPVGVMREKVRSERRAREIGQLMGRFMGKIIGAHTQTLDADRLLAMALRGPWSDGGCGGCGGGS